MLVIRLAQIGSGMTDADIVEVLVSEGDLVVEGQALAKIDTAKVAAEVESFEDGTVLRVACAEGETLLIGALLFVIGDPSEKEEAAALV